MWTEKNASLPSFAFSAAFSTSNRILAVLILQIFHCSTFVRVNCDNDTISLAAAALFIMYVDSKSLDRAKGR